MDTDDINAILRRDEYARRYFIGTFPCDQIPAVLPRKFLMCVNLDESTKEGSHWVAIGRMRSELWYFDSMGRAPPRRGPLRNFVKRFSRVLYNRIKHQSDSSSVCGGFTIFALCMFARGHSMRDVVKLFSIIDRDDAFISSFMSNAFGFRFAHHSL